MEEKLSVAELIELLEKMCLDMEASQEKLRELDAAVGDGDLGVTVNLGFKAIREEISQLKDEDVGTIFTKSGIAFGKAGASTFGALMAAAFMRAGGEVKGLSEIEIENVIAMMKASIEGIKERGKALPGECTMLDALIPVQEALEKYALNGKSLNEAMTIAAEAAEKGAESTTPMKARHGRAGWLAEKSIGVPDAGATAIAMMLRSASNYLKEKDKKIGK